MKEQTSAVILASGFSTRMQTDKCFLTYEGQTFLDRTVELAREAGLFEVIVVVRPEQYVNCHFPEDVKVVINRKASQGQSAAVKLGTVEATGQHLLFLPIDQPNLTKELLRKIADRGRSDKIVFPVYHNHPTTPIFFGNDFIEELLKVTGDEGGRSVRDRFPESWRAIFTQEAQLADIDTPESYHELLHCNEPISC